MTPDSKRLLDRERLTRLPEKLAADEFDVFLSYSRKDKKFAERLYAALSRYRPPRSVQAPRRSLRVFRDQHDINGTVLQDALREHLDKSAQVVLLCSPAAYASRYVEDELTYARANGPKPIIPVLVAGVPNAEAGDNEADKAFPPALLAEEGKEPLAVDFRDYDPDKDRITGGRFRSAWFQLLATLYGISQREIEERERARTRRRIVLTVAVLFLVASAGVARLVYTRSDLYQERRILAEATVRAGSRVVPRALAVSEDSTIATWMRALVSAGHGDAALATARVLDTPSKRASALLSVAGAWRPSRPREAAAAVREAYAATAAIDLSYARVMMLGRVTTALVESGQTRLALQAIRDAEAETRAVENAVQRTYALQILTTALMRVQQAQSAAQTAREALALAHSVEHFERAQAMRYAANALAIAGDPQGTAEAMREAQMLQEPTDSTAGTRNTAAALAETGHPREALAFVPASGDPFNRGYALNKIAVALAEAGQTEEATHLAREALSAARTIRNENFRATVLSDVSRTLSMTGQIPQAAQTAREALAATGEMEYPSLRAEALSGVAAALVRAGESREASRVAQDALAAAWASEDPDSRVELIERVAAELADAGLGQEVLAAARRTDDLSIRAALFARVMPVAGNAADRKAAAEEAYAIASEVRIQDPATRSLTLANVAWTLAHAGWFRRAREVADRPDVSLNDRLRVYAVILQELRGRGQRDEASASTRN